MTREERIRVLLEHSHHFESLWGERRFPAMRKHLAWYCKGFRGAAQWRARMVRAANAEEVARIVGTEPPVDAEGLMAPHSGTGFPQREDSASALAECGIG